MSVKQVVNGHANGAKPAAKQVVSSRVVTVVFVALLCDLLAFTMPYAIYQPCVAS